MGDAGPSAGTGAAGGSVGGSGVGGGAGGASGGAGSVGVDGGGVGVGAAGSAGAAGTAGSSGAGGGAGSGSVNPWHEDGYLKGTGGSANLYLGVSVAISGDTIVTGAANDSSSAVGVNGTGPETAANSGAAFVYVRNGAGWAQQAYVKASHPGGGDELGTSVAISGDTMVIGAPGEASAATGIGGNELDDSMDQSGAAYVFVRSAGSWQQQAYLKASNTHVHDRFGSSVSISGDTIVVGAPFEISAGKGVDGDQTPNPNYVRTGAAYVFVRSGGTWKQQAYLKASNTNMDWNLFGASVSASGDTIIVGAPEEGGEGSGVNGDQTVLSGFPNGAAYVFVRAGVKWSQEVYLKPLDDGHTREDYFGNSVAISGDIAVVGEYRDSATTTADHKTPSGGTTTDSGAVYVFTRSGKTWTYAAYLKASNADDADEFGRSVAIDNGTIVVGAWRESSNATGVDGNQLDNSSYQSGAAYVFTPTQGSWSQTAYLKAHNTNASDNFGTSVAIAGGTVVVGADGQTTSASGAAYVFR
ncbi:MAG TPA: hypothetical protein VF331_23180 [Polyangiales bacterium]